MPPPVNSEQTGGRLTGYHMRQYFQDFADKFLEGRIRFSTKVLKITRDDTRAPVPWLIHVRNRDGSEETLNYSRIVLCTGVCIVPTIVIIELDGDFFITRDVIHLKHRRFSLPPQHRK